MKNSFIEKAVLCGLMVLSTSSASAPKPCIDHCNYNALTVVTDISMLIDTNSLARKLAAKYPPANWQEHQAPKPKPKPAASLCTAKASPP